MPHVAPSCGAHRLDDVAAEHRRRFDIERGRHVARELPIGESGARRVTGTERGGHVLTDAAQVHQALKSDPQFQVHSTAIVPAPGA